ncbi:hypothetical protein BD309DRAFT_260553 [Dichomitus squalens]|uniref:Uncharacterized protein n=1 Tax=Dichomitus squalens TaxID=114155 RepID=A0A4Q9NP31_9APHY|nr:hypothetical protein BD309DRAFT_260553 [Dichomitus squalens]TBU56710.1 hypothetical protein BD310DRAFT_601279 [Dichomitus squalens]
MPHSVCHTLLDGGHMRCSAAVRSGRQSCGKHAAEYDASYKRYKSAENDAKLLRAAAQTKHSDVHTLPASEIEPRIKHVQVYSDALELELTLRRQHDAYFIGDPDEGHRRRLQALEQQIKHHRDVLAALHARLEMMHPAVKRTSQRKRRRGSVAEITAQSAPRVPQPQATSHHSPKRYRPAQSNRGRDERKKFEEGHQPRSTTPALGSQKRALVVRNSLGPRWTERCRVTEVDVMRTGDQSRQDIIAEVSPDVGVVRNEQEERATHAPEDGGPFSEGADPPCQMARALRALRTPSSPTIQVDTNEVTSSPSRLRMPGEYIPTDHEGAHSEHSGGDSERSHGLPEHGRRYLHYALAAILQLAVFALIRKFYIGNVRKDLWPMITRMAAVLRRPSAP